MIDPKDLINRFFLTADDYTFSAEVLREIEELKNAGILDYMITAYGLWAELTEKGKAIKGQILKEQKDV